jgi:hypothetical protein
MFYVYVYRDPKDKLPFYVGKGKGDRKNQHLKETKDNTDNYLKWCKIESIRQRNEMPIIEVVLNTESEDEAYIFEAKLILKYGRKYLDKDGILTNRCVDNRPPTYAGSLPRSEEYLKNMSLSKFGEKNPMFGISPWNKGLPCSIETKNKISVANKGRKQTKKEQESRYVSRGKTYEIISPIGETFLIKNLKNWCIENNFNYCMFREALCGYKGKTNYKGWTGRIFQG